ncbi:MAG: hypothetical protein IJX18_01560, partial [Clostridia bacterium]|nr:hypothetical protein [Clostridia bacterium]
EANFVTFIAYFVNPLLQLFICHFMLALVIHATDTTEWHREGSKARGMKTCRIFSMLTFLFALAYNVTHLYLNLAHGVTEVSTQMIFVAVIALALFVEECCMAKLPSIKKKYQKAESVESIDEESAESVELDGLQKLEVLPANYKYVDAPAVYMQPNGSPILVMPAMEVAEDEEEVPSLKVATPMGENALAKENYKIALKAKWMARAKGSPEEEEEALPLKKPSDEKDNLELGAEKKVKCPFCKTIVLAQEGAPAYECPECGEKFSFKKESK